MTGVQENSTTQQRRRGRARNTNTGRSSPARSGRAGRPPADQVLAELEPMISALIRENRELHRQIDKLSKQSVGAASGAVERTPAVDRTPDQRQPGRRDDNRSMAVGKGHIHDEGEAQGDGSATARAPTPDLSQS